MQSGFRGAGVFWVGTFGGGQRVMCEPSACERAASPWVARASSNAPASAPAGADGPVGRIGHVGGYLASCQTWSRCTS